jgi:hypothetical protein
MADDKNQIITKNDSMQSAPKNAKERLYDHIKIPIWLLDVVIALAIIAIVYLVVTGR